MATGNTRDPALSPEAEHCLRSEEDLLVMKGETEVRSSASQHVEATTTSTTGN